MSVLSVRRTLVFLLLALALTSSAGSAAGFASASPRGVTSAGPDLDIISLFWGFLTNALAEEGCMIDPNGWCGPRPAIAPAPTGLRDEGCMIDPDGRCRG